MKKAKFIFFPNLGNGYDQLTQLKVLGMPLPGDDSVFLRMVELDNLIGFDMSAVQVSAEAVLQISKLTNLEMINVGGGSIADRKPLELLPKLSSLIAGAIYKEDQFNVLNNMTQLTHLEFYDATSDLPTKNIIPDLTNLRYLDLNRIFGEPADFSAYSNLTTLRVMTQNTMNQIRPPKGLKALTLARAEDTIIECICEIDSLTSLQFILPIQFNDDPQSWVDLTRLTNLKSIYLSDGPTKGNNDN